MENSYKLILHVRQGRHKTSAANDPLVFTITEEAPTRAPKHGK